MKLKIVFVLATLFASKFSWAAGTARIVLPDLHALEAKATESVDVTLDEHLLGMAARFLDARNPEEANAKLIVSGLQGVYVRSYSFDADYSLPQADVAAIRRQLVAPQWNRIVGVRSHKENTSVEVFVLLDGERAKGLAVLALEPRKFTIVNIVGSIDLEKLRRIEGQLGVPKLELEAPKAEKKPVK